MLAKGSQAAGTGHSLEQSKARDILIFLLLLEY